MKNLPATVALNKTMTKKEIKMWIAKNESAVESNERLLNQTKEQIDFGKKIIEELYKLLASKVK